MSNAVSILIINLTKYFTLLINIVKHIKQIEWMPCKLSVTLFLSDERDTVSFYFNY